MHSILSHCSNGLRSRSRRRPIRNSAPSHPESLEVRIVPSVTSSLSSAGVLTINGDGDAETIEVSANSVYVGVESSWSSGGLGGGGSEIFSTSQVRQIVIHGRGGNDRIEVDGSCQVPVDIWGDEGTDTLIAQAGYHKVHGGVGNDTIQIMIDFDTILAGRRQTFSLTTDYKSGNGTDTVSVKLDGDSFARRFINPLVDNLQWATYALEPITDLLDSKVPVLGKIDSDITFARFLEYSSGGSTAVSNFVTALDTIRDLGSVSWSSTDWTIGTFKITSGKSATAAVTTVTSAGKGIFSSSAFMTKLRNIGIAFPAFDSPTKFVQTLYGQSVSLVEYSLPKFSASVSHSEAWYVPTGIAGVSVKVAFKGSIQASASMTVGLDTAGFWTGRLISDGFYAKDVNASLTAKLTGSGSVTAGIPGVWDAVEAGAKATVTGTLKFTLKDPNNDGKFRLGELGGKSFFGAVSRSGSISYELAGYVSYEVLEFNPYPEMVPYEEEWVFARGTLSSSSF